MFLDGPEARPRDAIRVVLAGEKVRPDYPCPAPDVGDVETGGPFRVLGLDALVRMKLTSYRDKDRVHLRDLADVGLIDRSWCGRLPPALAERLAGILDTPES